MTKRYQAADVSDISTATERRIPFQIKLDAGVALDIYRIHAMVNVVASAAGVITFAMGVSYKNYKEGVAASTISGARLVVYDERPEWLVNQVYSYTVAAESFIKEVTWDFAIRPLRVWASPTYIVGFSSGPALTFGFKGCEILGSLVRISAEEATKLQLEQKQQERTH